MTVRKARPGQVFVVVDYPCHGSAVLVLEHRADAYSLPCGEFAPGGKSPGHPVVTDSGVHLLEQGWTRVSTTQDSAA